MFSLYTKDGGKHEYTSSPTKKKLYTTNRCSSQNPPGVDGEVSLGVIFQAKGRKLPHSPPPEVPLREVGEFEGWGREMFESWGYKKKHYI